MNLEEFLKIAWFLKIQIWIQKHSIGYAYTCNSRRTIFHAGTHSAIQARANNNKKNSFYSNFDAESMHDSKTIYFLPMYL
jgi:hypothetical protein